MNKRTLRCAIGAVLTVAVSAVFLPSAIGTGAEGKKPVKVDDATVDSFGRLAGAVLTDRTTALLDGRSSGRIAPQREKKVRLSADLAHSEDGALSSLRTRKSRLAGLGEAYTAADTKVTTGRTSVKDGRVTVEVTETTTLTYKKIRGDEPATTGFKAHHELTFTAASGGKWELTAIRPTDQGPRPVNAPVAKVAAAPSANSMPKATPASIRYPGRTPSGKQAGSGYDYRAMAAYAEKYWRNYNPEYRKFNDAGGDCTNFISQALRAGGWKNAPGSASDYRTWWYDSKAQSTSWVGANEWSWFTLNAKRATNLSNVYKMDVGDIMQMDFDGDGSKDHSMITTYRSRAGIPYLTYHSTNTYRKSVASIIASNPDAVYYAYRT
ncbi:amidase domain-containing protein [Streptomyces sp. NPDC053048]|uniref:amidase domain-containing protein n=1 Tax=Streptomyces sp. NPDC053048 TaxID=3365694 RepID=UPI0037D462C4